MDAAPSPLTGHLAGLHEHNRMLATLDLADFEDVTTGELVILHPQTKAPTTSRVILAGPEHPARKQIEMQRTRRMRAEFAATGKMPVTDPVDEYDEQTEHLVTLTIGWTDMHLGREDLQYSPQAARAIYTDPKRQWFRAQVNAGLQKTELFIASSAKS